MAKQKIQHHPVRQGEEPTRRSPSPRPDTEEPTERVPEPHKAAPEIQVRPRNLGALFTKRPLILGEDARVYDELFSRVTHAIAPRDAIEEIWVKDLVDDIWESQRLRRHKASLLMMAGKDPLVRILKTAKDPETERPLTPESAELSAICCLQGDEQSVEEVTDILTNYALDLDSIMAQAPTDRLDAIERIDQLITTADARRDKALNNVDRRRETLARELRRIAEDV